MNRAELFLKGISRSGVGRATSEGLESSVPAPLPDRQEVTDRLRAEVDYIARLSGERPDEEAVKALAEAGKEGLDRLNSDGAAAALDDRHLGGLEAVINTDGSRPVAFVRDNFIDAAQPSLQGSPYLRYIGDVEQNVRKLCRATGRVDDAAGIVGYQGTAFVVGDDLVMTNRHVLTEIVAGRDPDNGALREDIYVDFGHEIGADADDRRRFLVKEIVYRGDAGAPEHVQVEYDLNFDGIDIALLRVDLAGRALPDALPLAFAESVQYATRGRRIYVVGFPVKSRVNTDVFDRVFGGVSSFKRLAPGEILAAAGAGKVPQDPRNWIMTHDASTLGGNSGSGIWDLDSKTSPMLGIHFAGLYERQNWAHSFERLGNSLGAEVLGELNIVRT